MSPFQDNKDGLQNVQLVMMGNGEENFGPRLTETNSLLWRMAIEIAHIPIENGDVP